MELEIIMLSEINQTQKDRHHIFSHVKSRLKKMTCVKIE
jgi:hypothetical protein